MAGGGGGPTSTTSVRGLPSHSSSSNNNNSGSSIRASDMLSLMEEEKQQHQTSLNNPDDNDLLGLGGDLVTPISVINPSDDDTVPSSAAATQDDGGAPLYYQEQVINETEEEGGGNGPNNKSSSRNKASLIEGYLQKLGRNGKWQKRYFETDGECLRYFKSDKRSTLLATLNLNKVGMIAISTEDPSGKTFHIQVADRPYSLRASTRAACRDWVITLNRIKEARMGVGGLHLSAQKMATEPKQPHQHKVVILLQETNRQRTQAIQDPVDWELRHEPQHPQQKQQEQQPQQQHLEVVASMNNEDAILPSAYSTASVASRLTLASWHKPQNTLYRIKIKMIQWARSIRTCRDPRDQVVEMHQQPAGRPMDSPFERGIAAGLARPNAGANTATAPPPSAGTTAAHLRRHHHYDHRPYDHHHPNPHHQIAIKRTGSNDGSVEFVVPTGETRQLD